MVTCVPRRGSLTPRCSFSATTSRMRSASFFARALSATGPSPSYVLQSVFITVQPPSYRQQLHFRTCRDQPLAAVQYIREEPRVPTHQSDPDTGPAVQVLV